MNLVCGNAYRYYCRWITPPHAKRGICVCDMQAWFFWFNSVTAFHGQAQLSVQKTEFDKGLSKDCFLDLSGIRAASSNELQGADDLGSIPDALRKRILEELAKKIPLLPESHRKLALTNLTT